MHGKDDVIISISVMYKHLVYPHLVGWMSQNGVSPLGWVDESKWCIPTWLGDRCMYESLVIGSSYSLSWVVESCYSFEKYFCRLCMCSGEAQMDWYILACTKGELNQRFQHVLRGSMENIVYIKKENILVRRFPLMSKGESDLVLLLPSSPKGEIVGIMIQVLSLLETHLDEKS